MDWYIRSLEPKDRVSFLSFLANWINHIAVAIRYQWLYEENPHGKALTWLAIHRKNEEIIGCTSIFLKNFRSKDHVILGAIGGNACVNPKFR